MGPQVVPARVDGAGIITRDDVAAQRQGHFGEAPRATTDVEDALALNVAGTPPGAAEPPRARDGHSAVAVELRPPETSPLKTEVRGVIHGGDEAGHEADDRIDPPAHRTGQQI